MSAILTLKNISKTFQQNLKEQLVVLKNINLEIIAGEFFVILGPSGSGKSTLLRIMSGLETKYEGKVKYGNGIKPTDFSFVFQHFALFPWLTVFENIAFNLRARHFSDNGIKERTEIELKRFGLKYFSNSYPRNYLAE